LKVGDYIYCIKVDDTYQTIGALGGYTSAINYVRGEKGTYAEFAVFRETDGAVESIEISVKRDSFETVSVNSYFSESNPEIGIIHISSFDLTTPKQFKEAVLDLKARGAKHFVFDVRYNPGGDLQSIKAVLTYFLQPGDLILSSIDKDGNTVQSYVAESTFLVGDYAACNVTKNEIGMFADLDMVVLCNGCTASAAEVFTATLRDYGLATVVGETTFGKGIMQSFLPMSYFGDYSGYVKLTTYAYVTQCGVTYHDIGIKPTSGEEIPLSEEALEYNFYVLPQSKDNQLQAALAQFQS
jgi:carboxyl-terminal processing protease